MSMYIDLTSDGPVIVTEGVDPSGSPIYDLLIQRGGGENDEPIVWGLDEEELYAIASAIREKTLKALSHCVVDAARTDSACTIWDEQTGLLVRLQSLTATALASHIMILLGEEVDIGIQEFPIDPADGEVVGRSLINPRDEMHLRLMPVNSEGIFRAYIGENYLCTITPEAPVPEKFPEADVKAGKFPAHNGPDGPVYKEKNENH